MLKLPMIFGDNMVLQRGKPVEIWGSAGAGETVTVELRKGGTVISGAVDKAGEDGAWRVLLPAVGVERDLELAVSAGEEQIVFTGVLVGEVWIAGGQSNMEFFMNFDAERESAYAWEEEPDLRFFDYPEVSYQGELEEYDFSEFGFWRRCRREELRWWSAVGCWFAKRLHGEINVPIGIVGCNWGGTRACCWIARDRLQGTVGEVWLRDYERENEGVDQEKFRQTYLAIPGNVGNHPLDGDTSIMWPGFTREFQLEAMKMWGSMEMPEYANLIGSVHPWRPCGLYETMLVNVAPYTCRGVIWYQGESDELHPEIYDKVLEILTRNWRDLWHDELPFLMVQLAPFGAWLDNDCHAYPTLRERQAVAAREIPSVWLASSSDCGMEWDIHPKHKRPIGERLALLALGHVYGRDIPCDAPELESVTWENGELTLTFKYGDGLYRKGDGDVGGLLVDGEPVKGAVRDGKLVIPAEKKPVLVELGQHGYFQADIYNGADLPVKPFSAEVR